MIGYCVCVCVCVCVLLDAVYSFRLPVPMIITIFISCILQVFGGVKVVLTFAAAAAAAAAVLDGGSMYSSLSYLHKKQDETSSCSFHR